MGSHGMADRTAVVRADDRVLPPEVKKFRPGRKYRRVRYPPFYFRPVPQNESPDVPHPAGV